MLSTALTLIQAQYESGMSDFDGSGGAGIAIVIFFVIALVIGIIYVIAMWKLFEKANQPGWAAIISIYNVIVMLEIAGKPWWWIFLLIIPLVSIIFYFMLIAGFNKAYGKEGIGGILAGVFFFFIYYPIIAFSSSTEYQGSPS